jgi:hypothetical protein
MEEKIDKVLEHLESLDQRLRAKEESLFGKILKFAEKLLIPLAVAAVAYYGNQAATKISEGQLRLAENSAADRKDESRRIIQAKYVEIFYKDLNSGDPKKQGNALKLIRLMDADLAEDLAGLVAVTPGVAPQVRAGFERTRKEIETFGSLFGFKIGIYFLRGSETLTAKASDIKEKITDKGFQGTIQLYPSDKSFFDLVREPRAIEVRYEPGREDGAADSLMAILRDLYPELSIVKRAVTSRTPGFISIFISTIG